jgi:SHS2 domain-containing protein
VSGRGHRVLPHTADVIVEAWGQDLASCIEEAVTALVDICFDTSDASTERTRAVAIGPGAPDVLLLSVLDELIFLLDTSLHVPVGAAVAHDGDQLAVEIRLAERDSVEPSGAGPKAISRSDLSVVVGPDEARCSFLVDV